MSSFLTVKDGIYDPSKRFAFTNITDEDFITKWNGVPIKVAPKQTVTMQHHLAVKATGEMVDKIMLGEIKAEEMKMAKKTKEPLWRSPKATSVGVPAARKPYEDMILKELQSEDDSPEIAMIKASAREEITRDINAEPSKAIDKMAVSSSEFAEIKKS